MSAAERAWARALIAAAAVVAVDQASKAAVASSLALGETRNVFFGLDLTYARNKGVAFGAFSGGGVPVFVLTATALCLVLGYFVLHAGAPWLWLPVGMVVGGALGNLADRAREQAVVDFLDPMLWPAFNLADASIVLGVLGLLYLIEASAGKG